MSVQIRLPDELEKMRQILVDRILQDAPDLVALYVYGSQTQGGVHPGSDLDLALLMPRELNIPAGVLLQLQGDLEALAGVPVQVSVLKPESQFVHRKEVVAYGVPIYVADPNEVAAFEMQTLSSYAQYSQDRRLVTAAYIKEK